MSQTSDHSPVPFIDLIGDMEENFYQLGLKDAQAAQLSLAHLESLIKTPWQNVDSTLRLVAQSLFRNTSSWRKRFSPALDAYAQGLGVSSERLMLAYLIPELSACMNRWLPRLPKNLFGCSSLFYRNDQGHVTHARILDFPLGNTFDVNERIVRTQFPNAPTIVSCGSAGFPYAALTAMTSEGVTLALHQKFNNVFDTEGTPIFELIQDLLSRCGDLKSCLEYLKKAKSLTTWSVHLSFDDGQVLEADLCGSELNYRIHHVDSQSFLYFNNKLIRPAKEQSNIAPLNFENYNQWRWESASRKLASLEKKKEFRDEKVLKQLTTLEKRKRFSFDVLTSAALQVAALSPQAQSLKLVVGRAPKTWQGQLQIEENLWQAQRSPGRIEGKKQAPTDAERVCNHVMQAQSAHDLGNVHQLHHHLQMALRRARGKPQENWLYLFKAIFTFLHETHPRELAHLNTEVAALIPKLDGQLKDHAYLLLARLERCQNLPASVSASDLQHECHRHVLSVENNIPQVIFNSVIRGLIYPRLELLDVIHLHQHLASS